MPLGDGVGVWLEAVMMLLLPTAQYNKSFGPMSDPLSLESQDAAIKSAWSDVKLLPRFAR
jgi:hypothetical protein